MIVKSFSKINLSLNVNKKMNNGLHDLQSYFCLIDLYDLIQIKKIKGKDIQSNFLMNSENMLMLKIILF